MLRVFNKNEMQCKRNSNFELLRIVCMLFIICGHIMKFHSYENWGGYFLVYSANNETLLCNCGECICADFWLLGNKVKMGKAIFA